MSDDAPAWAREQLDALHELTTELDRARLSHWLIGGWAIDFHLGRISRSHSDIDLALKRADRAAFVSIATAHGFTPERRGDGATAALTRGAVHLEATYLAVLQDGRVYTPGFEHWPYPEDAFSTERIGLAGVTVPVMSAAGLLDTKQGWQHQIGEPPRPHDLADIEALRALIAAREAAGE